MKDYVVCCCFPRAVRCLLFGSVRMPIVGSRVGQPSLCNKVCYKIVNLNSNFSNQDMTTLRLLFVLVESVAVFVKQYPFK